MMVERHIDGEVEAGRARYPSLRGRSVLITGGAQGIGEALVQAFVEQGSKVAFIDLDAARGYRLAETMDRSYGLRPLFLPGDLREVAALRASIEQAIDAHGPIRVLINNAGNDERQATDAMDEAFWDNCIATNLKHFFFAAQAVHQPMAKTGGAIVNMGSIGWMKSNGNMAAYGAAKAGVHGLTKTLARDFGTDGIRVNTITPGWIMTERQIERWLTPEGEAALLQRQCLKRKLQPDDVARMALWLASDDSEGCTAQNFIIDAGTI